MCWVSSRRAQQSEPLGMHWDNCCYGVAVPREYDAALEYFFFSSQRHISFPWLDSINYRNKRVLCTGTALKLQIIPTKEMLSSLIPQRRRVQAFSTEYSWNRNNLCGKWSRLEVISSSGTFMSKMHGPYFLVPPPFSLAAGGSQFCRRRRGAEEAFQM